MRLGGIVSRSADEPSSSAGAGASGALGSATTCSAGRAVLGGAMPIGVVVAVFVGGTDGGDGAGATLTDAGGASPSMVR
jgi:hypothetical protein